MSRQDLSVRCIGVARRIIERAVAYLELHGYELREQRGSSAKLIYSAGSTLSAMLRRHRHSLELVADGELLHGRFEGRSGVLPSSKLDVLELSALLQQAAARSDERELFHCRFCRRLTPMSRRACTTCGAENFS